MPVSKSRRRQKAPPPCRSPEVPVTIRRGVWGPFRVAVMGQPGCPWDWMVEDDDDILSEGTEPTEEAAMRAAEKMADELAQIAAEAMEGVPVLDDTPAEPGTPRH